VDELERMYRLLAMAKFNERYVIPQGHSEVAGGALERQGAGGFQGSLVPIEQFGKGKP
jgi:nitrate reductase beta subunit